MELIRSPNSVLIEIFCLISRPLPPYVFFFFNDPATPEFYPFSLPDALPICLLAGDEQQPVVGIPPADVEHMLQFGKALGAGIRGMTVPVEFGEMDDIDVHRLENRRGLRDRKSTRLNSSHLVISYADFCLT